MRSFFTLLAPFSLAIMLISACGGDETESSGSTPLRQPTPYDPTPPDATPPKYDAAAITAALPSVLATLVTIDPDHMRSVYEGFYALNDGVCPAVSVYPTDDGSGTTTYWADDCVTADGTRFAGGAYLTTFTGRDNGDGSFTDGYTLYSDGSDATIVAADGRSLTLNTYMEAAVIRGGDSTYTWSYAYVYGDGALVVDEVSAAGDLWLTGARKGLVVVGGYADSYGTRTLDIQAGLSLDGSDFVAVSTDALSVNPTLACTTEPAGALSLRDTEGTWYDVRFDANPPDEETEPGVCDGCGTVLAAGRELGAGCPATGAFDGLLQYEETPWQ